MVKSDPGFCLRAHHGREAAFDQLRLQERSPSAAAWPLEFIVSGASPLKPPLLKSEDSA